MKKFLICVFCLILCSFFVIPANAYQITQYEMHHEAGMVVYLDKNEDVVIYEKNADKKMYPGSITVLLTALVMVDEIPDIENTKIVYTNYANNLILGTSSVILNLKVGEEISAKDALAALLVSSCGDAAYAIAEHVGGSKEGFAKLMNEKAAEIGLTNSHFTNPVGLHDDEHYTTARDIYKLALVCFKNELIKELCSSSFYKLAATNMSNERTIVTSNMLINVTSNAYYKYAKAGKTGYTEKAGRCVVSTGKYSGYEYMVIVLNAKTSGGVRNDFKDAANMFRWAFNNFEYKSVFESTTPVAEAPIKLARETDFLPICFESGFEALLPKDANASTLVFDIKLDKETYSAPIKKGTIVGTADIYYAEEKIGSLNLVAGQSVKSDFWLVIIDAAKRFLTSPFMIVVYILVGIGAIVFSVSVATLNSGKKKRRKVKYIPLSKEKYNDFNDK